MLILGPQGGSHSPAPQGSSSDWGGASCLVNLEGFRSPIHVVVVHFRMTVRHSKVAVLSSLGPPGRWVGIYFVECPNKIGLGQRASPWVYPPFLMVLTGSIAIKTLDRFPKVPPGPEESGPAGQNVGKTEYAASLRDRYPDTHVLIS